MEKKTTFYLPVWIRKTLNFQMKFPSSLQLRYIYITFLLMFLFSLLLYVFLSSNVNGKVPPLKIAVSVLSLSFFHRLVYFYFDIEGLSIFREIDDKVGIIRLDRKRKCEKESFTNLLIKFRKCTRFSIECGMF